MHSFAGTRHQALLRVHGSGLAGDATAKTFDDSDLTSRDFLGGILQSLFWPDVLITPRKGHTKCSLRREN